MNNENDSILFDILGALDREIDLPDVLYHYTDSKAFLGIVDSNELWATDWRYLNDENELVYGLNLLKSFLREKRRKYSSFFPIIDQIEQTGLLRNIGVSGVFCFSEKGDLLSQWRGYGKGYDSVSIGFDPNLLRHHLTGSPDGPFLVKVVYDVIEQKTILDKVLSAIDGKLNNPSFIDVALPLYFTLLFFKDECWKEETEWRVLSFALDAKMIRFRSDFSGLVPYMPLKIFPTNAERSIKEIIVPKSKYFARNTNAIEILMPSLKGRIKQSSISIDYG